MKYYPKNFYDMLPEDNFDLANCYTSAFITNIYNQATKSCCIINSKVSDR